MISTKVIIIIGLSLDLVGAFFLSIPMVFGVDRVIKYLNQRIAFLKKELTYMDENYFNRNKQPFLEEIMVIMRYSSEYYLGSLLLKFFSWLKRKNLERRIGAIGLLLLCIGFSLQAYINWIQLV